ncbi:DMT family transporter [Legionella hackeliae]|uniref:Transporter, drug/metabolite exporter family n=1 Tax=Legionella hackeliae TaxID=449 RepID=A0A0A8UW58_LEGHA|nr:DMT family transporter [Legionella hackeliae]KTD09684.1 transmembrane protein [Legionella hackeliae]CEK10999.1 Transporter, drug/metabolite exporter family [Legionella hackeliae]STX47738.1 transmembrane protein [Legionella hackeliae]
MLKNENGSKGLLFLILAQIMVGINIVSSKILLVSIPLSFLLMMRFTLATLILFPLHWMSPARQHSLRYYFTQLSRKDWYFIFAQALSAGVLFNCLMLLGLHYTDANIAGIITSTLPAIIAIMSWIILKEKIAGKQGFCILFATLGLAIIAYDKLQGVHTVHSFIGDSIILFSLLPEAAYYVLCKISPNRLPVFITSALMNGINALLLIPTGIYYYFGIPHLDLSAWWILFLLGLSSGLFYVFWYFGCQLVDGIMASLSTAVMPLATVILAWIILGEQLTVWQCVGMGLVLLSIVIYAKK